MRAAEEVQRVALSEVTYVPWGQWSQPTALRKNVHDVLKFGAPIFWNVKNHIGRSKSWPSPRSTLMLYSARSVFRLGVAPDLTA